MKEDFYKIDWGKVHENDNNINDAFNSLYKALSEILDHHSTLVKTTKTERTLDRQRNSISHVEKR